MSAWREFSGLNAGYVLEQYTRYRHDPYSVDPATRAIFETWTPPVDGDLPTSAPIEKIVGAVTLADAIRRYGHLEARIDPLGGTRPGDPWLDPATYGLTDDDLRALPASLIGGLALEHRAHALDAIQALRAIYSSTCGYEYHHVQAAGEREWLRQAIETRRDRPVMDAPAAEMLLDRLTQVEAFERFLHRLFPGKTRFSIEGLNMLVPMLDDIIAAATRDGIRSILIGTAHRGRLNLLAHILHKPYTQILAEFKDPVRSRAFREDLGWTGDVKYHKGARITVTDDVATGGTITMAPNASHVEAVDPIIEGMARAAGTRVDQPAPRFDPGVTLPLLIHGDAAFSGQGIVAETLNLSRLSGYHTGGTIHIIANNQLGYTTLPQEGRSTLYASDLAKGFEIPIVHVNADDPEACLEAARLAFAYRAQFHKDVLIDLVGYRRWGHNEGDEPAFTQPVMYRTIADHPTVRDHWARVLVDRRLITNDVPERLMQQRMKTLQEALDSLPADAEVVDEPPEPPPPQAARRVHTAVPAQRLRGLHAGLLRVPDGFTLHPKLARAMERRREALADAEATTIDWATAESLAFASILEEGIAIRLTGQDTERGTFSQRHAVFHDAVTGATFIPLQALPQAKVAFEVCNSPLSENAALGFEYGYNVQEPGRLVIWEAQYGDFVNNAQTMIDEFIVAARAKWGQTPSLVLLLPHGYEGQGPDHSSGRLECFLQLTAATNLRIANCTTAAQYFHLLRRQALLLTVDPLPLVVMTPKSLLRHPRNASSLRDLTEGRWHPVIDDADARAQPSLVRRVVLCSGKVWVDLVISSRRAAHSEIAIIRLEQVEPFPIDDLRSTLDAYPGIEELVWVQEEPENMGAWMHSHPYLQRLSAGRWPVHYVGRPRSASPAEGSAARHQEVQAAIVARALDPRQHADAVPVVKRP